MIKMFISLLFMGVVFSVGYYLGTSGVKEVKGNMAGLKEELVTKTHKLEGEVSAIRFRLYMDEVITSLASSKTDLTDKNFGTAAAKIQKASESLSSALALANEFQKKVLTPLPTELRAIHDNVLQMDGTAVVKISGIEKEISKLRKKS